MSLTDVPFRESLHLHDLSPADGMPAVWIGRCLGIAIKDRVAGSDFFDTLRSRNDVSKPLKAFLLGRIQGAAASACQTLNPRSGGSCCVGSLNLGFGSVEEISGDEVIYKVNASAANFLVLLLGAYNGQLWLQRNNQKLLIPIRANLGSINFQTGTVAGSPRLIRKLGLELLWRIKEEPAGPGAIGATSKCCYDF
jgi:N-acetylglucosaminyldiphosphoundecaprenol N-acetyl-beta-D-mannosaminyltransferase